jgi:DNA-binding NarL/FixJ family response regulator
MRSLIAHGRDAVTMTWPPDRLLALAVDLDATAVVLGGPKSGPGLRAIAEAIERSPELCVVIVGPLDPSVDALIAVACGAMGYVADASPAADIAAAVEAAVRGEPALPAALCLPLMQHLRSRGRDVMIDWVGGRPVALTGREWELLVLLRQAYTSAEVADRLAVTPVKVRSRVAALVHKLGAVDSADLAAPLGNSTGQPQVAASRPAQHGLDGNGGQGRFLAEPAQLEYRLNPVLEPHA